MRSATACGPRQRSAARRSRSRTSGGVGPGANGTRAATTASPGCSAATAGSTGPATRSGSPPLTRLRPPPARRPAPQRLHAPRQRRLVQERQRRARHLAAAPRERDERADGDAVRVRHGAVAVVADRDPPAALPHRVPVAAHGHRREGHAGEARRDAVEHADLALALLHAGHDEREHERPVRGELADVESRRARGRRRATSPARRRTLASPSSSLAASGAANGGSGSPTTGPREPTPSVRSELAVM